MGVMAGGIMSCTENMLASSVKAKHIVLDIGAKGMAGDGLFNAIVKSLAAAMIASAEDKVGILT